jgi:hypothetical protein
MANDLDLTQLTPLARPGVLPRIMAAQHHKGETGSETAPVDLISLEKMIDNR